MIAIFQVKCDNGEVGRLTLNLGHDFLSDIFLYPEHCCFKNEREFIRKDWLQWDHEPRFLIPMLSSSSVFSISLALGIFISALGAPFLGRPVNFFWIILFVHFHLIVWTK
jgi:hypothetical protein